MTTPTCNCAPGEGQPHLLSCEEYWREMRERDVLASRAPEMLALLRELEWAAPTVEAEKGACPSCGYRESLGHTPDCRLGTILKQLEG